MWCSGVSWLTPSKLPVCFLAWGEHGAAPISHLKIYTMPRKILSGLLHLTASSQWYWIFFFFLILHVWPAGTVNREMQLKVLYEALTPGVLFIGLSILRSFRIWKQAHLLCKRKTRAFEIPQVWNGLPFYNGYKFQRQKLTPNLLLSREKTTVTADSLSFTAY